MGHITKHTTDMVSDTQADKYFYINDVTRQIVNTGSSKKLTLVKGDHNSEVFTFELQKEIEGHDMSQCNRIEVHYINIGSGRAKSEGVYEMTDSLKTVTQDGKEYVTCEWLISRNATQYAGNLTFSVIFECVETEETTDADGNTVEVISEQNYAWHSAPYTNITVLDSIDNKEIVLEPYVDILEQWWAKIEKLNQDDIYVITDDGDILNLTNKVSTIETEQDDLRKDIDELQEADEENVKLSGDQTIAGSKTFEGNIKILDGASNTVTTLRAISSNNVDLCLPEYSGTLARTADIDDAVESLEGQINNLRQNFEDGTGDLAEEIWEVKTNVDKVAKEETLSKVIDVIWPAVDRTLYYAQVDGDIEDSELEGDTFERYIDSEIVQYTGYSLYNKCYFELAVGSYDVSNAEENYKTVYSTSVYDGETEGTMRKERLAWFDTTTGTLNIKTRVSVSMPSDSVREVGAITFSADAYNSSAEFEFTTMVSQYAAHTDFTSSEWIDVEQGEVVTLNENGTYQIRLSPYFSSQFISNEGIVRTIEGIVEITGDSNQDIIFGTESFFIDLTKRFVSVNYRATYVDGFHALSISENFYSIGGAIIPGTWNSGDKCELDVTSGSYTPAFSYRRIR